MLPGRTLTKTLLSIQNLRTCDSFPIIRQGLGLPGKLKYRAKCTHSFQCNVGNFGAFCFHSHVDIQARIRHAGSKRKRQPIAELLRHIET